MTVENHPTTLATAYQQVYKSDVFRALKRRRRRFVLPISTLFITWYATYIGLAYYAPGFMAVKLAGNITVALVAGILQILSTLALATFYVRFTEQRIDPEAAHVRHMVEQAQLAEQAQRGKDHEPEFFHSAGNTFVAAPVSEFREGR